MNKSIKLSVKSRTAASGGPPQRGDEPGGGALLGTRPTDRDPKGPRNQVFPQQEVSVHL